VLTKLAWVFASFFRLFFRGLFYRLLVKIYYGIFRLKKSDLAGTTLKEFLRRQTVWLLILTLTIFFTASNLFGRNQAGAMETKMPDTIMSDLTPSEFDLQPDEELIEETASTNQTTSDQEKYLDGSCTLDKQANLILPEELNPDDLLAFNDSGDIVFKPQNLTSGGSLENSQGRTEIIYYTVQNGDTVSTIARRFSLTVNTILWANNLTAFSLIRPGDTLTILPCSGVLYTVRSGDTVSRIATKYGIEAEKITSTNNLGVGIKIGQKIILPGAKKISETAAARQTNSYTGLSVIRDLVKAPTSKVSGSKMTWPTVGHRITQYFSWRHNGVDIGNKVGTPIYAADAGVVEISTGGWNGGYGNTILINHGGGKKTRYGHLSKLFVKAGDAVEKGENIGAMGSTGRSTGPHLHFEILINGGRYNPLNYIK